MVANPTPLPPLTDDIKLCLGGFTNRILLALSSALPNEIDWALSTLLRLSHSSDKLYLQSIPGLLLKILQLCADALNESNCPMSPLGWADPSEENLDDVGIVTDWDYQDVEDDEDDEEDDQAHIRKLRCKLNRNGWVYVQSTSDLLLQERATIGALVLRNLSFVPLNAKHLAASPTFLYYLARAIAAPDNGSCMELRRYALETLESIACYLRLESTPLKDSEPPSVAPTSPGCRMIRVLNYQLRLSQDTSILYSSYRVLSEIIQKWSNEPIECGFLDLRVIQRTLAMLTIEELDLNPLLDYLYAITLSPQLCLQASRALLTPGGGAGGGPGVLSLLLKLVKQDVPRSRAFDPPKVQSNPSEKSVASKPDLQCQWRSCSNSDTFSTPALLKEHVESEHIHAHNTTCEWLTCSWAPPNGTCDRLLVHVSLHLPSSSEAKIDKPTAESLRQVYPHASIQQQIASEVTTDPVGVPYTASLILRNLARVCNTPEEKHRFARIQEDLILMIAMYPRLAKCMNAILSELTC
jgi:hypothetical protein